MQELLAEVHALAVLREKLTRAQLQDIYSSAPHRSGITRGRSLRISVGCLYIWKLSNCKR